MNDVACQAESRGQKAAVNKCKRGYPIFPLKGDVGSKTI